MERNTKPLYIDCPSCHYRHGPLAREFTKLSNGTLQLRDRPVGCPMENTPAKVHRYTDAQLEWVDKQIREQL